MKKSGTIHSRISFSKTGRLVDGLMFLISNAPRIAIELKNTILKYLIDASSIVIIEIIY
jgi:hypothetical protein